MDVLKSFGWMDKGLVIPQCLLSVSGLICGKIAGSWRMIGGAGGGKCSSVSRKAFRDIQGTVEN